MKKDLERNGDDVEDVEIELNLSRINNLDLELEPEPNLEVEYIRIPEFMSKRQDKLKEFPPCPENISPELDWLSEFQKQLILENSCIKCIRSGFLHGLSYGILYLSASINKFCIFCLFKNADLNSETGNKKLFFFACFKQ